MYVHSKISGDGLSHSVRLTVLANSVKIITMYKVFFFFFFFFFWQMQLKHCSLKIFGASVTSS